MVSTSVSSSFGLTSRDFMTWISGDAGSSRSSMLAWPRPLVDWEDSPGRSIFLRSVANADALRLGRTRDGGFVWNRLSFTAAHCATSGRFLTVIGPSSPLSGTRAITIWAGLGGFVCRW